MDGFRVYQDLNSGQLRQLCISSDSLERLRNLVLFILGPFAHCLPACNLLCSIGYLPRRYARGQQDEDKEDSVLVSHDLG